MTTISTRAGKRLIFGSFRCRRSTTYRGQIVGRLGCPSGGRSDGGVTRTTPEICLSTFRRSTPLLSSGSSQNQFARYDSFGG
jgi:hypothetical protein